MLTRDESDRPFSFNGLSGNSEHLFNITTKTYQLIAQTVSYFLPIVSRSVVLRR